MVYEPMQPCPPFLGNAAWKSYLTRKSTLKANFSLIATLPGVIGVVFATQVQARSGLKEPLRPLWLVNAGIG